MTRAVRELASARCGDKGNTLNAVVVADDEASYEVLDEHLTADRVAAELAHLADGPVTRYEVASVRAFNFVIEGALAGGVTKSLRLDRHGKTLSYAILGIELDVPE